MKYPENLQYSASHEWLEKLEEGVYRIGITHYAADQMGGVVFVDLPEEEDDVTVGDSFAEAESVKAVAEIISPVNGVIAEVNADLEDNPALLNESPYEAWIVKVTDVTDSEDLMDASAYQSFVENL